jgi:hypothetical protein
MAALSGGCVQEMANQPRVEPLEDARRADEVTPPRGPMPGTVARGQYHADEVFETGKVAGEYVTALPQSLSLSFDEGKLLLHRSDGVAVDCRERYGIFCSHCHGLTGGGEGGDVAMRAHVGMVVKRGFPTPPTYHQQRLREAPIGRIFDVIGYGVGRMPAHGSLMPLADRWAIAAYVKALQLSQLAPRDVLSPEDLAQLNGPAQP